MVTSGIRIGVPAVTTRGLMETDMVQVADFINRALEAHGDDEALAQVKADVAVFMRNFPLYQDLIETSPALSEAASMQRQFQLSGTSEGPAALRPCQGKGSCPEARGARLRSSRSWRG